MALFVKFWGTRGSIPTPGYRTQRFGGNTSCVEIRTDETLFICDGGTGLRELGQDIMRRYGDQPITLHLFLSHTHWDHIQGFPFFTPAYLPSTTIYVYGSSSADRNAYDLLTGQMQSPHFPVSFSELRGTILPRNLEDGIAKIDGVTVRAFAQNHPGGSLGFIFEHGQHTVVYSTDNELDQILLNAEAAERDPTVLRLLPPRLVEFARDADLLIADGQYTDAEYATKVGWGHPRATTVVDFALQAGVRQLAIFHHDPMQSDQDVEQKIADCHERVELHGASKRLTVFGAREGMELKIG